MSRDKDSRISDILDAIARSRRYLEALDSVEPNLSDMAEDAIERNLQIIGEATKRLPSDFTDSHPEIPWSEIRGFRNILVHQYFGVDKDTVRDVVERHLAQLERVLRS